MLRRLKVYAGEEHPHKSQNPIPYELKEERWLV
jgi:ribosomal protein L13